MMSASDRRALDAYITRGPPDPIFGTCARCGESEEDHYVFGWYPSVIRACPTSDIAVEINAVVRRTELLLSSLDRGIVGYEFADCLIPDDERYEEQVYEDPNVP